jgi:hypothetical protein
LAARELLALQEPQMQTRPILPYVLYARRLVDVGIKHLGYAAELVNLLPRFLLDLDLLVKMLEIDLC